MSGTNHPPDPSIKIIRNWIRDDWGGLKLYEKSKGKIILHYFSESKGDKLPFFREIFSVWYLFFYFLELEQCRQDFSVQLNISLLKKPHSTTHFPGKFYCLVFSSIEN
jgi:hypothetical protein